MKFKFCQNFQKSEAVHFLVTRQHIQRRFLYKLNTYSPFLPKVTMVLVIDLNEPYNDFDASDGASALNENRALTPIDLNVAVSSVNENRAPPAIDLNVCPSFEEDVFNLNVYPPHEGEFGNEIEDVTGDIDDRFEDEAIGEDEDLRDIEGEYEYFNDIGGEYEDLSDIGGEYEDLSDIHVEDEDTSDIFGEGNTNDPYI